MDPSLETIRSRIGEQRCHRTSLLRDILERGAAVTFGTDWPAACWFSTYKPLDAIETAVTRRTLGEPDTPALEPQDHCLDLAQALRARTADSPTAIRSPGLPRMGESRSWALGNSPCQRLGCPERRGRPVN